MSVEISESISPETRDALTAFTTLAPLRSHLQHVDWPHYAPRGRFHSYRWVRVLGPEGDIRLFGILRLTRAPVGPALATFRRGPVTRSVADLAAGLGELLPELRRRGIVSLTVSPWLADEEADACEAMLVNLGAEQASAPQHSVTGLIDVTRPFEAVVEGLSRTARRKFRSIERADIAVRPLSGEAEIARFATWNAAFHASRGTDGRGQPPIPQMVAFCRDHGGYACAIEHEGRMVGAFAACLDGDRLSVLTEGWDDPHSPLPRAWIYLREMIAEGVRRADVAWVDLAGLATGDEIDDAAQRRNDFKGLFNPRVVRLVRPHRFVLRPLAHRFAARLKRFR